MSDETPPPSLRLKPRQRPEGETPPAPAPAAPEAEAGKLRLKPKLSVEPPAEIPAEPPAAEAPPAEKIRLKPKLNQEPAQAEAAEPEAADEPPSLAEEPAGEAPPPLPTPPPEEGKIKLKIKVPGAAIEAAAADEPADEGERTPPPFPVVISVPPELGGPTPPPSIIRPTGSGARPGAARPGPPGRRPPPSVLAASTRRKKIVKLGLVAIGSVALAIGIISLAKYKFIDPPPAPSPRIPRARPVEVAPEVPVAPPEDVSKLPTEEVDRTLTRPRTKSGATSSSATTDLAPGVTVTTEAVEAEVEASQSFRTFVADAKISGVFQGTPSRAFINGRLIRVGETVDSGLGIRFESVDPKTKSIVFKDTSGASVSRRY